MSPELPELDHQGVRQEHIAGTAVLGDLRPQPDATLWYAGRTIDIPYVEAYKKGKEQDAFIKNLMTQNDIAALFEEEKIDDLIHSKYKDQG